MSDNAKDGSPVKDQRPINGDGKVPGGITGRGFRPGQSGCPGGRPAGRSISAELRKILTAPKRRELAQRLIALAMGGDVAALKALLDRHDGAVRTAVDLAMVDTPAHDESAQSFYARLKARSLEAVARHFPGFSADQVDVMRVVIEDSEEFIDTN